MAQHSYTGAFRIDNTRYSTNASDSVAATGDVSAWTPGATIIDTPSSLTPSISANWKLLAVEFLIGLAVGVFNTAPSYGKLGRIVGGVIVSGTATVGPINRGPWVTPALPLPSDLSLVTPLWDGNSDPAPTIINTANQPTNIPPTFITGGMNLPQPVDLQAGDTIGIGLWILPSLVRLGGTVAGIAGGLWLQQSRYTIIYDDGL